jgi:uncharacterized protein YndB with AHSA1/START domain
MSALSYEMVLPADRDRVWWALTTEEGLAGWLCCRAEIEPFVGGQYELYFEDDVGGLRREPEVRGQVLSIDHPRLLQLAWSGPGEAEVAAERTELRVRLYPTLEGTRLEILHAGSEQSHRWDDARASLERLWIDSLERLQLAVQSSTQRT